MKYFIKCFCNSNVNILSDFAESYISFISQSSDAWQVKRLSAFLITISEYSGKGDEG